MRAFLRRYGFVFLIVSLAQVAAGQGRPASTEKVLYSFRGGDDGMFSYAGLVADSSGNFYGTTSGGGNRECSGFGAVGCGTVFQLTRGVGGVWTETVIHAFEENTEGGNPFVAPVMDDAGNLYGTNLYYAPFSSGAAWQLSPSSGGNWTENTLVSFNGSSQGFSSYGLSLDPRRHLYGTAYGGGSANGGLVFQLTPGAGGHWADNVLYNFMNGADGDAPAGPLAFDSKGSIIGTTYVGGPHLTGTVFELTKVNRVWTEQILYMFKGLAFGNGQDGANPLAGVISDRSGNLFGTTYYGGPKAVGTVFS